MAKETLIRLYMVNVQKLGRWYEKVKRVLLDLAVQHGVHKMIRMGSANLELSSPYASLKVRPMTVNCQRLNCLRDSLVLAM